MRHLMMTGLALMLFGPEPGEFLRKAVVEGLKEDGADPAFINTFLVEKRELFVLKCPICENVRKAFAEYAAGKPVERVKGKGLPKDIVDDLKNPTRLVQLKAVERLVDRYVSSHYERLKMSPEDRENMQARLESWKKEGMKMKELGPQKDFGDFCPSCNGATKSK
jgi:hypothetical protein